MPCNGNRHELFARFIKNNTDIVWSNINSPKWNGNAKMMG